MIIPTEEAVLEILNEYKWDEEYFCYKCGHVYYKKGKQSFSRRCKKCDYDESLLKFTAFEGVKLPIGKVYAIIEHFVDECKIDWDKKDILLEKQTRKGDESYLEKINKGHASSINSLLDKLQENEIGKAKANELLSNNMNAHSINLSEIARIFDVEENSVSKLLDRISDRFSIIEEKNKEYTSAEHIFSILREGTKELDYFLGLLMIPMDETWIDGKKKINDKSYFTVKPPHSFRKDLDNTRWRTVEVEIVDVVKD
ncbi:MAG: hypothetical protein BGO70_03730 [Bacteroidetes bacterium 43-93]|uniref:hypothetical protein n=1 Tax=uncultured Dysgonomonas sp. TaxID=206096 RepID=UPI000928DF28|nr:hypothetical protein [uncultured Dysgonomonas sp.]MBN9485542.1 hypothetical protein [Bacteroidota bacterium]OJW99080.1 MAG: hypothetical protein BGO70_03730 [Bacteroidetes bacterium 43-93]